jgi:hypothetical protein
MAQTTERFGPSDAGRAARPPIEAFWTGNERSVLRVWQRSPALAWSLALPVPAASRTLLPGNADDIHTRPSPSGETP